MTDSKYAVVRNNPHPPYTFTKWHNSISEAVEEAKRLAIKEERRFFVIRMIGYADKTPQPVEYTEC